jgi:hypothetical protein
MKWMMTMTREGDDGGSFCHHRLVSTLRRRLRGGRRCAVAIEEEGSCSSIVFSFSVVRVVKQQQMKRNLNHPWKETILRIHSTFVGTMEKLKRRQRETTKITQTPGDATKFT